MYYDEQKNELSIFFLLNLCLTIKILKNKILY
jgi:hypothetical protein